MNKNFNKIFYFNNVIKAFVTIEFILLMKFYNIILIILINFVSYFYILFNFYKLYFIQYS